MARIVWFAFLFAGLTQFTFGQVTDCEQTLNQATAEFEAGRFYGLPDLLKSCLKSFSKEQKVRAYLLLTQVYLVLDDPASAESSYLQLLKADPEYVANPGRDPIDVYYLSKKFTSTPIFTPYFRIGINTSLPRTIYHINTNSNNININNAFKVGYQIDGGIDWNINERWSVSAGLGYSRKSFKTTNSDNSSQLTSTEKQDWIDVPVYIKYSYDSGRIRPFGYAGMAANLLIASRLSLNGTDFNSPSPKTQQVSQGPDVTIPYHRNFFNRSIVLGGGAKYKVGINFFYLDVRYMVGLTNLGKNSYSLANGQMDPLATKYGYASDYFRLDNLSISLGFVKPLYNPRKKKRAVAGFLEKLGIKKVKR